MRMRMWMSGLLPNPINRVSTAKVVRPHWGRPAWTSASSPQVIQGKKLTSRVSGGGGMLLKMLRRSRSQLYGL